MTWVALLCTLRKRAFHNNLALFVMGIRGDLRRRNAGGAVHGGGGKGIELGLMFRDWRQAGRVRGVPKF